MNNNSPVRTAISPGKKGMTLGKTDTIEQKKKPKLKEAEKGDLQVVELDSPTSVTL